MNLRYTLAAHGVVPVAPGVMTPTEIIAAAHDISLVKHFPTETAGVGTALSSISAVVAEVDFAAEAGRTRSAPASVERTRTDG